MSEFNYYVLVETKEERGCPHFDTLAEALDKYNSVEKKSLFESVCLGIESKVRTMDEDFVCFDVLHKFIDGNILINDYLAKDNSDVRETVFEIINSVDIKYQYTSRLLHGGVLIPYGGTWVMSSADETMDEKWNEIYLTTYKDGEMVAVGWQGNNNETHDKYGWSYRSVASYVTQINVRYKDSRGAISNRDIDVREYLRYHKIRFTGV